MFPKLLTRLRVIHELKISPPFSASRSRTTFLSLWDSWTRGGKAVVDVLLMTWSDRKKEKKKKEEEKNEK